ncbi:RHBT3 protein, partial [Atractosteus spatula]|nr:RHBT3 protein [Atractosteus spatula]
MSSADRGVLSAFVGKKEDVVRSGRVLAVVHGREVVVIHHAGVFYAMDRLCYHAGGPLHLGDIEARPRGLGINSPASRFPGAQISRPAPPDEHLLMTGRDDGVARDTDFDCSGSPSGLSDDLRPALSVHIVALGSEGEGVEPQSGLIWTYLGRSAGVRSQRDTATHTAFPAFIEYQACVSGGVRVVIHDCPSWDLFDSNWYGSRNVVGQADIIVLKYSVNDKPAFRELKDSYTPVIKRLLSQWAVPVIVAAVGARQNACWLEVDQSQDTSGLQLFLCSTFSQTAMLLGHFVRQVLLLRELLKAVPGLSSEEGWVPVLLLLRNALQVCEKMLYPGAAQDQTRAGSESRQGFGLGSADGGRHPRDARAGQSSQSSVRVTSGARLGPLAHDQPSSPVSPPRAAVIALSRLLHLSTLSPGSLYPSAGCELFSTKLQHNSLNECAEADCKLLSRSYSGQIRQGWVIHSGTARHSARGTAPHRKCTSIAHEGPPCTCPLCTSDKGSCVPTCEGLELSRELGATYLELHSLSDVSAGNYFGGVLEYFIIQCLKQKSSESTKKKSPRARRPRPPLLEQPATLPAVEAEKSSWSSDWLRLLDSGQCADVLFCAELSGRELAWAHRALLCSVSPVFKQLLAPESHDPGPAKASQSLFSERGSGRLPASVSGQDGHFQLSVRDPLLSRCLPEILRFLYTGASNPTPRTRKPPVQLSLPLVPPQQDARLQPSLLSPAPQSCWSSAEGLAGAGASRWKELELSLQARLGSPPELRELLAKVRLLLGREQCSRELRARRPTRHPRSPLAALFHSPLLSDVVFKVEGAAVPAHRAVLAARCEVMAAMFSGSYVEASSRVVPVYGVSKDCFVSFLEYLYTDSCCPASVPQAMALLVCAEMYQVPRLQHLCEVCICTRLQSMSSRELASSSLGVVELLGRAQFHHAPQLSTWLLHFIASNYLIFSQKPDFSNLTRDERDFVEKHRWPSSAYVQELAEFRCHVHRRHARCAVM